MKIEELKVQEFDVLDGFPDQFKPDPNHSIAIVVRDGDDYVGRIFLVEPCHIEGPYLREDKRGGTLAQRLVRAAENTARDRGIKKMFAYAVDNTIAEYLERLGYSETPFKVYAKEL